MDDISRSELIYQNYAYKQLRSYRRRMMLLCLAGCLVPLGVYLAGTMLFPGVFADPLAGTRLSVGMVLSLLIFIGSWLFTGFYTHVANTKLDDLRDQVLTEVVA